jgi:peptide-methionine (S)-S-oxide reductase
LQADVSGVLKQFMNRWKVCMRQFQVTREICTGRTGHAEAVKVYYDSSVVSYQTLVDVFFNSHDPTTLNRQGPDSGTQYRSAVFYQTEAEKKIVKATIKALLSEGEFNNITTEVSKLDIFYDAEDYHQDYERNNPNQPYIKGVSIPRLNAFKAKMPEVLK